MLRERDKETKRRRKGVSENDDVRVRKGQWEREERK
jgi:hypothetical protein